MGWETLQRLTTKCSSKLSSKHGHPYRTCTLLVSLYLQVWWLRQQQGKDYFISSELKIVSQMTTRTAEPPSFSRVNLLFTCTIASTLDTYTTC